MAISDWRRREIRLVISKGKDAANEYLNKITDTIDSMYDNPKDNLGVKVQKLHAIITCFMVSLPVTMGEVYTSARDLRGKLVQVNPTAHRNRSYGFGELSLEVEEETGYMIGETQEGMKMSSRRLTDEENQIYFAEENLLDGKLILPKADEETDGEYDDEPRVFLPGFKYDDDGNIIKEEK